MIEYAYTCHNGMERPDNEDNFWCRGRFLENNKEGLDVIRSGRVHQVHVPCFAVFDGIGGADKSGADASELAAEAFGECYKKLDRKRKQIKMKRFMHGAAVSMNRYVCEYGNKFNIEGFGSTAAMVGFWPDYACICNIGDCRVYLNADRKTVMLSKKQAEQSENAEKTSGPYLGSDPDAGNMKPAIVKGKCRRNDRFLICTNGLTDTLSEREIGKILTDAEDATQCVKELLRRTLARGGKGNTTLIVCDVL